MIGPRPLRIASPIGAVLLAMAAFAPVAVADDAPPVVVGTTGITGLITVTATSPGSGGGGGSSGGSPVGNGGGSASGGSSGGGSASPSGGGSSDNGSASPSDGGDSSGASVPAATPTVTYVDGLPYRIADLERAAATAAGTGVAPGPIMALRTDPASGAAPAAAPVAPGAPVGPPPPPPPSPAEVAQIAISQLRLKAATPHLSANPNTAVGLPVWMWVDRTPQTTGPMSTTATAGPTSVTATATLSKVIWSMGQPGGEVACAGPGSPAPGGPLFAGDNSPDCGYSYTLRSLKERTGGVGKWPVTATSVWSITWFGGGQAGAQNLNLTASTAVEVGELQAVVVPGGGN